MFKIMKNLSSNKLPENSEQYFIVKEGSIEYFAIRIGSRVYGIPVDMKSFFYVVGVTFQYMWENMLKKIKKTITFTKIG